MAQLVASASDVVLGGVAEVVGSKAKYLQHLSAQLIHYIPLYIYIYIYIYNTLSICAMEKMSNQIHAKQLVNIMVYLDSEHSWLLVN